MAKENRIVVIGSTNTDMVIKSNELPKPGETVLGGKFQMIPGGKGANQAVAAATLDGEVTFVTKLGNDMFGKQAISNFEERGIDTQFIRTDENTPSGVALIMVDDKGENSISVALGANNELNSIDIVNAEDVIANAAFVLIQLEIPVETVAHAIEIAAKHGTKVILNPAPARELSAEMLKNVAIITPNETETELLTGIKVTDEQSAQKASIKLNEIGVETVIITMGSKGAYVYSADVNRLVPSVKVEAVDTTAAGDTFNGALAVVLAEGTELIEAVDFANKAAACSVTKMGAQTSAPTRKEVYNLN